MKAITVLKMPRRLGDKLIKAHSIEGALTGNPNFPLALWPNNIVSLAQFSLDVQAFEDAEVVVATGLIGAAAARDAALTVVMNDLYAIKTMVQLAAEKDPANAEIIIESAGFSVKKPSSKPKLQNDAFNTEVTGTVLLTADGGRSHEWQMSKDQIDIINLPATHNAQTYVKDLTPGDVMYFRNRKLNTKTMTYNWSPWKKLIIGPGGRIAKGISSAGASGSIATL